MSSEGDQGAMDTVDTAVVTPDEPLTAAQRGLALREILDEIMRGCSKTTLCALARTSSSFSEPALDELWRVQIGLQNLFACLPSHLWKEGSTSLTPEFAVGYKDWTRFDKYARRIRELQLSTRTDVHKIYVEFLARRRGAPQDVLFPRLSVLGVAAWNVKFPALETLFGPQLASFTLKIPRDCAPYAACLSYLPHFSPQVTYLALDVLDQVVVDGLGEILLQFGRLRVLVLESHAAYTQRPHISNSFCNAASALPALRQLHTSCPLPEEPCVHLDTRPDPTSESISFPALEYLEFYDYDRKSIRACTAFLRTFKPVKLTFLSLRMSGADRTNSEVFDAGESAALIRAIHGTIPHSQLLEFYFVSPGAGIAPITLDVLRLLFPFDRLRKVTLLRCLNVDDTAFEEASVAWPNLKELHTSNCWTLSGSSSMWMSMVEHRYWANRKLGDPAFLSPTLRALEHLVQHCRRLERLFIEVAVSKVEALQPDTPLAGGFTNTRICKLELGRSCLTFGQTPGTSMFHASTFLLDLFPNLTEVITDEEGPSQSEWKQVEEIVRGLSSFCARSIRSTSG